MTDVVLFHHVRGLTPGVRAFADRLRAGGHTVHTPDLFDGRTFDSIPDGFAYVQEIGFDELSRRAVTARQSLPTEVVFAGMSLGVMPAVAALQDGDARGGLLLHGFVDPTQLGGQWPTGVPAQVHGMDGDEFFTEPGGDLESARATQALHPEVEIHLYPGEGHLFTDSTDEAYDAEATDLVVERSLEFLGRLGS